MLSLWDTVLAANLVRRRNQSFIQLHKRHQILLKASKLHGPVSISENTQVNEVERDYNETLKFLDRALQVDKNDFN